jgi:hypothetical protein
VTLDEVLEAFAAQELDRVAVVGAVARNAWAPPRATADLDLTVGADATVIEALHGALGELGYRRVREQQVNPSDDLPDIITYRADAPGLRQVDVLVAKTAFEVEALERAVEVPLTHRPIRVVTAEDLIVYKLIAHRSRDVEDIRAIIQTQERAGRQIDRAHIERWAAYWDISARWRRLESDASG